MQWKNISLNNRTYKLLAPDEPLVIENLATHPSGTGFFLSELLIKSYLGNDREKALAPIFKSVNYGIIENND